MMKTYELIGLLRNEWIEKEKLPSTVRRIGVTEDKFLRILRGELEFPKKLGWAMGYKPVVSWVKREKKGM